MDFTSQFSRTLSHIRSRWPTYIIGYGGGSLFLIFVIVLSVSRKWYSFAILSLVGLLFLIYFLAVSLWAYHTLYDDNSIRDTLFEIGELSPTMTIVDINLGLREFPVALSRRLTTGKVIVLDVYNPLMAPNRALAKAHNDTERPASDPRLSWRDGSLNLLPLPDNSVQVVTLIQTASELWQDGDRLKLFQEAHRILRPGGCLLLAERMRTPVNLVVSGPGGLQFMPWPYWKDLIVQSNFKIGQRKSLRDLILCLRVDKRRLGEKKPLPVDS